MPSASARDPWGRHDIAAVERAGQDGKAAARRAGVAAREAVGVGVAAQPEVATGRVLGLGKGRRLWNVDFEFGGRRLGDQRGAVVDGDAAVFGALDAHFLVQGDGGRAG